jgi:tetratricopeptide (TPR) repeat protein
MYFHSDLIYSNMRQLIFSILTIALLTTLPAWADKRCEMNLANGYGPWDYYNPKSHVPTSSTPMGPVRRVTNVHLKPQMLRLTGRATGTISGDLDYTLRAIPNHPLGLDLASRLELRLATTAAKQLNSFFSYEKMVRNAECYFRRALSLNNRTAETYFIYGIHLHRNKKYQEAAVAYEKALSLKDTNIEANYNYGLTLVKLERYSEAEIQAVKAYSKGYPLSGLKNLLTKKGFCESGCATKN